MCIKTYVTSFLLEAAEAGDKDADENNYGSFCLAVLPPLAAADFWHHRNYKLSYHKGTNANATGGKGRVRTGDQFEYSFMIAYYLRCHKSMVSYSMPHCPRALTGL